MLHTCVGERVSKVLPLFKFVRATSSAATNKRRQMFSFAKKQLATMTLTNKGVFIFVEPIKALNQEYIL